MTRVSENSKNAILSYNLARAKEKLEGLQIKGSSLKKLSKISDDPYGGIDLLALRSHLADNQQFVRNLNYAKSHLEQTESAISDLSEVLSRAKEIAIAYSSNTLGIDVRRSAAQEVGQLYNESVSIANRRMGNRYLFGGYTNHRGPFDNDGRYLGDEGHSFIEVRKDFFVPINLTGAEVFFEDKPEVTNMENPELKREVAASGESSIFRLLESLQGALKTGQSRAVQNILQPLDQVFTRMVTLRTRVGALYHSLENAEAAIDDDNVISMSRKSMVEDAEVDSLFSELEKQSNILQASYKTGATLINQSLLDFVR